MGSRDFFVQKIIVPVSSRCPIFPSILRVRLIFFLTEFSLFAIVLVQILSPPVLLLAINMEVSPSGIVFSMR